MQFKHGNITLIHGDCMEYMQSMDWKADLAIVDPPYGIGVNVSMGRRKGDKKSKHHKFEGEDKSIPTKDYFDLIKEKSLNQIVWGGNYMTEFLPPSPCWIMWDKGFSEEVSFAQIELAWTSFKSSAKKYEFNASANKSRIHPTQKPVALYKWLLANYAKKGERILDTHGGSMSIAIACHDLGFELVCIEKDLDYFNAAVKRFKQHIKQSTIQFPDQPTQPTQSTLQL